MVKDSDNQKTIKELAEDLKQNKNTANEKKRGDDYDLSKKKEELRRVVLEAIKEEDMAEKERSAARSADEHIFAKKNFFNEIKEDLQEKFDNFYKNIFSRAKNLRLENKPDKKSVNQEENKREKKEADKKQSYKMDKSALDKTKKIRTGFLFFFLNLIITLLLLSGLIVTLVGVAIYQNSFLSSTTQEQIINLIPYPAGIVNNHFLSIAEFRSDVAALNRFYAVQKEAGVFGEIPKSTNIQDIVWERYIQNSLIQDLADRYNISLSDEEIKKELNNIIAEAGGEENLDKQLAFLYGWSIDKFTDKIIKPYLLREKIAAQVFHDKNLREEKKEEALQILQKVKSDPDNFAEYAKQYSQDDSTKNIGGDLGYFVEGVVVKEIESALKDMNVGEISDLMETNEGFEIFKLEDKITGKDGRLRLRARRILIRYPTFEELLTKERRQAKIYRFIY